MNKTVAKQNNNDWDVIVVGGGASGMMAAATAASKGAKVLLLEKNPRLGKKLSITGGGRCNVTNNKLDVRTMVSQYKESSKFLFSTFTQHGVKESIEWFADRGVQFVEENEGRLFPETLSAETICKTLEKELQKCQVKVVLNTAVLGITKDIKAGTFLVETKDGSVYKSTKCIVSTGGISRPETGSTGEGFQWLQKLGHSIRENDFALVPISLTDTWVSRVSGITLDDVKVTIYADAVKKDSVRGKILFTHVGLSGPTILNISSRIGELLSYHNVTLGLDLFPSKDYDVLKHELQVVLVEDSNKKLKNILSHFLPKALVQPFLQHLDIDGETKCHSVRSEDRVAITHTLKNLEVTVKDLLGSDKAVISGGGVVLTEIDFKTMGSKVVPGLYITGDVLDIDRPSGGYSLQLCWSTGYVAGQNAAKNN